MDIYEKSVEHHEKWKGKTEIASRVPLETVEDISIAYTPGVAQPCLEISKNPEKVYSLTRKWNSVAIVTDGSAILGLGDIGPEAGLPVMEGKAVLFKKYGGVDAVPICLACREVDEIVDTVLNMAPTFGGINLEDISSPRCFEIERRLEEKLGLPVFHDDQHGTAIVILAALTNALKLINKKKENVSIAINGAGAAAIATARLLLKAGFRDVVLCDSSGAIFKGKENMNPEKELIAEETNLHKIKGTIKDVIAGRDIFIGLSTGGVLNAGDISAMSPDSVVLAMANPTPEIYPEEAKKGGARITGTGRSDYKNQVNNALVFPGLFRGALDARAKKISYEMKIAAAYAIAECIRENELHEDYIIPSIFNSELHKKVAQAVMEEARKLADS